MQLRSGQGYGPRRTWWLLVVVFGVNIQLARADVSFSTQTFSDLKRVCARVADGLGHAYGTRAIEEPIRYLRLGVTGFEENGRRVQQLRAGMVLSDWLAGCLFGEHHLRLVERRRLDIVAGECSDLLRTGQERHAVGCFDSLGAADLLLVGQVSETASDLMLTVRVVHLDGAAWLMAENTPLGMDTTLGDVERMLDFKSPLRAALWSLSIPGAGQLYNDEPWKGAGYMTGFFAAAIGAGATQLASSAATRRFELELRSTQGDLQEAHDLIDWRNGFLVTAAVLWTASIVDAYLNGYEYRPSRTYELSAPELARGEDQR